MSFGRRKDNIASVEPVGPAQPARALEMAAHLRGSLERYKVLLRSRTAVE